MKNSLRKRILALGLSAILAFNGSISCLASEIPIDDQAIEMVAEEVLVEETEAPIVEETEAPIVEETEVPIVEETETETEVETESETEAETESETVVESEEESKEEKTVTEEVEEETEAESEEETEETITQILEYVDEDVKVVVEAASQDAIPEEASLKVTPITVNDKEYDEVEKQLNEKAEDEEYEIAGFLAYDITFVDKDGNKVEPNGDVRVTIEYKKATLPEAVNTEEDEEVDVTVMHFEEDAQGEVKEVVDMVAEEDIDAEVTTTDQAEVEKAEFVTDSFSVFTITWTRSNKTLKVTPYYVYYNGSEYIKFTTLTNDIEEVNPSSGEAIDLHNSKYAISITGYKFKEVRLDQETGTIARYLKRISGSDEVHYSNDNNGYKKWASVASNNPEKYIYYIYEKDTAVTAERVDSDFNSQGSVKLELQEGVLRNLIRTELVETTEFDFTAKGYTYTYVSAVVKENNGAAIDVVSLAYREGAYYYTTIDGTEVAFTEGTKLYLTYDGGPAKITTVDSSANHINIHLTDYSIWSQDAASWDHEVIYSVNGKTSFNFATQGSTSATPDYNKYTNGKSPNQEIVNKNLVDGYPYVTGMSSLEYLFNDPAKTYSANYLFKMVDGYYVYDSEEDFAQFNPSTNRFTVYSGKNVGFFPFNKVTDSLTSSKASETNIVNHHFGMNIDFTFMQPKSGVVNEDDMIFSFSGDDDVWVFIDDMLVLDLGGIHQRTDGSINFKTGEITYSHVESGANVAYNIRDAYIAAIKEDNPSYDDAQAAAEADEYFVYVEDEEHPDGGYYRFKDYSQHKLNFFYFERGAYDTNCKIEFNLISIPKNKISIEKEITESNMADFADAEFTFKIEKQDAQTNGEYGNTVLLANTSYELYEVNSNGDRVWVATKTTDANGQFKLKHRQVAEFSGIPASTKYCVTEVDISSDVYKYVYFNGTKIEYDKEKIKNDMSTGFILAQNYVYVKFQNQCNADNLENLVIEKQITKNLQSDEFFKVKVEFAEKTVGANGETVVTWNPYSGKYFLGSSTGTPMTTTDGFITLKAGQSAHILELITGTQYRVTEVLSETQSAYYEAPIYSGVGTVGTDGSMTGTIVLDKENEVEYKVTVTNTLKEKDIEVTKIWTDSDVNHDEDTVYVGLYKDDGTALSYVTLNKDNQWTEKFEDLRVDYEYVVKELVKGTNPSQTSDFTIGDEGYIAAGDYTSFGIKDYKVTYDPNDNYTEVAITNTLLEKIEVEKSWLDGNKDHRRDSVMVGLYKVYTDGTLELVTDSVKTLNNSNEWKTVYDKLEGSSDYTYTVKELIPGTPTGSYTPVDDGGAYTVGTDEYKVTYTEAVDSQTGVSKITVTNALLKSVEVNKVWTDSADHSNHPVHVGLYEESDNTLTPTASATLTEAGGWTHTFTRLDPSKTYVVRELAQVDADGEFTIDDIEYSATGDYYRIEEESNTLVYKVSYTPGTSETYVETFTITNQRVSDLVIDKISSSTKAKLSGATFKLQMKDATTNEYVDVLLEGQVYTVETDSNGFAKFENLTPGDYRLVEVQAPTGYSLLEKPVDVSIGSQGAVVTKQIENHLLYELPQSGGNGIYWYMIAGTMLMMMATAITYKNRRKEVLERINRR